MNSCMNFISYPNNVFYGYFFVFARPRILFMIKHYVYLSWLFRLFKFGLASQPFFVFLDLDLFEEYRPVIL